jgi:hypothetical protein
VFAERRGGDKDSSFGGKADLTISAGDDPAMGSTRRKMEDHGQTHISH